MKRVHTLIVGGGPAGLSTALFLAAAAPGLTERVVVLEKERYPREKFCAGGLGTRADTLLAEIGVRVDVPSVPINGVVYRAGGRTTAVRQPNVGRVVRRFEFDHELARITRARGVRIEEGVRVLDLSVGEDGVSVRTSAGEVLAEVVVGADGVGSIVRRRIGLTETPYRAQALEVDTEPVASDDDRDLLGFDSSDHRLAGYYWDFPTLVDNVPKVCRGVYRLRLGDAPAGDEIQTVLEQQLAKRGLRLGDYKKKRFAERGFERRQAVAAPRALLVGEAAGIDPLTGEGIAQAIQYGAVAAAFLVEAAETGDYSFNDWSRRIRATMIGRDLIVRSLLAPRFFGVSRARFERFAHDNPSAIRVGLQHFGGQRWNRTDLARASGGLIRTLTEAAWDGVRGRDAGHWIEAGRGG